MLRLIYIALQHPMEFSYSRQTFEWIYVLNKEHFLVLLFKSLETQKLFEIFEEKRFEIWKIKTIFFSPFYHRAASRGHQWSATVPPSFLLITLSGDHSSQWSPCPTITFSSDHFAQRSSVDNFSEPHDRWKKSLQGSFSPLKLRLPLSCPVPP
jgi:hypothetical protein